MFYSSKVEVFKVIGGWCEWCQQGIHIHKNEGDIIILSYTGLNIVQLRMEYTVLILAWDKKKSSFSNKPYLHKIGASQKQSAFWFIV